MRTGHYKLSAARSSESFDQNGQFKLSCRDFHPLSLADDGPCNIEYPHMNSLLITPSKKGLKGMRHRSCENVYRPKTSSVNVERKVRGFLSRTESKFRSQNSPETESCDGWQVGRLVTLPRKRKLSSALSVSALNTLTFSDTVSCLSASSGYSSSSSNSSYGSFKSSASMCSSLPRQQDGSTRQSPPATNRVIIYDNPLYDVTPQSSLSDSSRLVSINGIYDLPSVEYLTTSRYLTISEGLQDDPDPVARRCKEFFERRAENSELLRRRLSTCGSRSDISEGKSDSLLSNVDDSLTGSESGQGSNSLTSCESPKEKNPLDEKMDFLRNEIASLTQQDNNLFKQLLALHDSISCLKIQNGLGSNSPPARPHTPSSLSSFSEEEQDCENIDGIEEELSLNKDNKVQKTDTLDQSKEICAAFTRARKSYAPTARNRRRSSSVHHPRAAPAVTCEETTALVVVHTDDEDSILKPLRQRAHTYTTKIEVEGVPPSCRIQQGLNLDTYSGSKDSQSHRDYSISSKDCIMSPSKNCANASSFLRGTIPSSVKCSSGLADTSAVLAHPPFREALIM